MRVCQLICIGVGLTLTGCASWHRPGLVYPSDEGSSTSGNNMLRDLLLEDDEDRPAGPQLFNQQAPTLTPPIEGVSHRTGYRGQPERARPARKDRVAVNPPGLGFIELPPPPDAP